MDNDITQDVFEKYDKEFPLGMSWNDAIKKLKTLKNNAYYVKFCKCFLRDYLDYLTLGFEHYSYNEKFEENPAFKDFIEIALSIEKHASYYPAIAYFFKGDYDKCLDRLNDKKIFNNLELSFEPMSMINIFFVPFKDAFPGFWVQLAQILKARGIAQECIDMCYVFNDYYNASNNQGKIEVLEKALSENTEMMLYKELLGIIYYDEKQYNLSSSYFEQVADNYNDNSHIYYIDQIFFWLGYASGHAKDHNAAIQYYEKAMDINGNLEWLGNNLGYEYYAVKQYEKAERILKKCLDDKMDLPNAAINYARVLYAAGKIAEAKAFVKISPVTIPKNLVTKIDKASLSDKPIMIIEDDNEAAENGQSKSKNKKKNIEAQFSSEKLLEDELESRILSGVAVFGKKLKMYKRRGEYGRQFIIPNRRIDLLTEDDEGNLYVIELKKDSGYDDPYQQIVEYIDWLTKNKVTKGKKVYGIICLNSPSKDLIKKVNADIRVQMFEYRISYSEIK